MGKIYVLSYDGVTTGSGELRVFNERYVKKCMNTSMVQ